MLGVAVLQKDLQFAALILIRLPDAGKVRFKAKKQNVDVRTCCFDNAIVLVLLSFFPLACRHASLLRLQVFRLLLQLSSSEL